MGREGVGGGWRYQMLEQMFNCYCTAAVETGSGVD